MDVSGAVPVYEVRDVVTPFGTLRDKTPIPGDVVVGMAESITEIQANFPPNILLGPPPNLTFEVDEGRGFSDSQAVTLTNGGSFGSLLGATLATSAPYVTVSPAAIGNLAANESGSFGVTVDSTLLLAADGPYSETVVVQDPNATNSPQTFSVNVNVRPKAIIAGTPTPIEFTVVRPLTGPFPAIPSQVLTVENTGPIGSVLSFQVQRLTNLSGNWLNAPSPVSGTLTSGQTQAINLVAAPVEGLAPGTYQETLRISGFSTNEFVDVLIQLVIT